MFRFHLEVALLLASGPWWSGSEHAWFSSGLPTFNSGYWLHLGQVLWFFPVTLLVLLAVLFLSLPDLHSGCFLHYQTYEPLIKQWHIIPYKLNDGNGLTLHLGRSSKWEYFHRPQRLERQVVQRLLATALWPRPVTLHWAPCQRNLCQAWEQTFLAPWLKPDVKCHQNCGQTSSHEGAMLTGSWHLLSAPAKIKSGTTAIVDLQHSLKGVEGGDQERGLCALGKLAEQAFR